MTRSSAYPPSCPPRLVEMTRHGHRRRVHVDLRVAVPLAVLGVGMALWCTAATGYVLFRDELLTSLVGRQREMQFAYEDRIAALRTNIDRLTSRQLIDQDTLEGKVQDLIARQALLETRQAVVASLATQAESLPRAAASPAEPPRLSAAPPVQPLTTITRNLGGPIPDGVSAFAPLEAKPRPEADPLSLRGSAAGDTGKTARDRTSLLDRRTAPAKDVPAEHRLTLLDATARRLEAGQIETLSWLESRASSAAARYQKVIGDLGLDRSRIEKMDAARPQGGPLVPIASAPMPGAGPFETLVGRLQAALTESERLRRVVDVLPLRRPLRGEVDTTSGFGYRIDPFTRGMAMHTGLDFKDEYGASVRATAPGRVVAAEWSGGYGNMVEVDHGFGLSTRYAHLSAISVSEGQKVESGTVLGKLGSTGRSTGPHLHYETRIDGEPVDPVRWLRAGSRLGPG